VSSSVETVWVGLHDVNGATGSAIGSHGVFRVATVGDGYGIDASDTAAIN